MAALIFSHQRCGSSNLLRFVRAACGVPAKSEPFNLKQLRIDFPSWNKVHPTKLRNHFKRVLRESVVVKHIYGQHEPHIDAMIAGLPEAPIIFLYRENAEASALSTLMARRLGTFNESASKPLGRIEIIDVETVAQEVIAKRRVAIEQCQTLAKPLLVMRFEELFTDHVETRRQQTERVLHFLSENGIPRTEHAAGAFSKFMSPDKKINSANTYRMIENIEELREAFPWLRAFAGTA